MNSFFVVALMLLVVAVRASEDCNGFVDVCSPIAHGAHGCECRPFDANRTNEPLCVGDALECNRANNRCYFCPEGEFSCDCLPGKLCGDEQLVCVRGHCTVGNVTTTRGGKNQTCFTGTTSYTRCESPKLACDLQLNQCVDCPDAARPIGCGCAANGDCASGLMCDAPSGVCAPCAASCTGNCTRVNPEATAAVQQAAIALTVTLVLLVVIGLVVGFVVNRRRQALSV